MLIKFIYLAKIDWNQKKYQLVINKRNKIAIKTIKKSKSIH